MANIAKAYRRDSKYLKKSLLLLILFLFMLCVELLFDFTECIRFMLCFVSNNEVNISIDHYNQIYLSNFRFMIRLIVAQLTAGKIHNSSLLYIKYGIIYLKHLI